MLLAFTTMSSPASSPSSNLPGLPVLPVTLGVSHYLARPAAKDRPVESALVAALDPESPHCLPFLFSGPADGALTQTLERAIRILCDRKPVNRLAVCTPAHEAGILATLAETLAALYPSINRRRFMRSAPASWPVLCRRDLAPEMPTRRVLVVDQLEEIFDPGIAERDRIDFATTLASVARHPNVSVLLAVSDHFLPHCAATRAFRRSFNPRFHVRYQPNRTGGTGENETRAPTSTSRVRPHLQPIRPHCTQERPSLWGAAS